jgi:hypothetical protein
MLPTSGPTGQAVFWTGADGNIWTKNAASGWQPQVGSSATDENVSLLNNSGAWTQIADPNPPQAQPTNNNYDPAAAAQKAKSQTQIDAINRLLGYIGSQKDPGLQGIEAGYTENNRRLGEQKTRAMQAYTDQDVKNTRNRESGYGQVDKFVNQSANSLSRVFQGANAGNSSVARLLAPQLVGKAGGERRQGVTETANENAANIKQARKYADQDFTTAEADLLTQRDSQKRSFLDNITQQEADLLGKRQAYEQDAGLATDGTQNEINARFGTLQSLLGQYKPTYNTKTVTADPAKFSEYSVDPAKLQLNSNQPAETRYYGTNLKKKFGEV